MNKALWVMLLAIISIGIFLAVSREGDVAKATGSSPAGSSGSEAIKHSSQGMGTNATTRQARGLPNQLDASAAASSPTSGTSAAIPASPIDESLEQRYQSISNNTRLPSLSARLAELHELYPYRQFSPTEVLDLMSQRTAWQPTNSIPDTLPLTAAQRNDGREFIELRPERFEVLLPGDSVELPMERLGMHLPIQVDRREPLPNGGFTLHGRVLGSAESLRVTITHSGGLSIAGIDTPQGHVVMQANDDHGWIATSETLFKHDPHRSDMVLPHD